MMEKYGTYIVYKLKKDPSKIERVPLHNTDLIEEFSKNAEWEEILNDEEVRKEVRTGRRE